MVERTERSAGELKKGQAWNVCKKQNKNKMMCRLCHVVEDNRGIGAEKKSR